MCIVGAGWCALAVLLGVSPAGAVCGVPAFQEAAYSGNGNFHNQPNAPYTNGSGRSGDFEYRIVICNQAFSDQMWWAYDFDAGNWNDGRGLENFCDITKMLGRTYTALQLLNYSEVQANQSTTWDDLSGSPLRWGGNYAHLSIDELDGVCTWPGASATTVRGLDDYTNLYKGFVYGAGISARAAILVHEARHASGVSHDGNSGSQRCYAGGDSCDETFTWNTSSGKANSYDIYFANDFYFRGQYTNTWSKQMAKDRVNYMLHNRFDVPTPYRIP